MTLFHVHTQNPVIGRDEKGSQLGKSRTRTIRYYCGETGHERPLPGRQMRVKAKRHNAGVKTSGGEALAAIEKVRGKLNLSGIRIPKLGKMPIKVR